MFKTCLLILLLIIKNSEQNEKFITTIKGNDKLVFREHVYRGVGIHVSVSGVDMQKDDQYEIQINKLDGNVQKLYQTMKELPYHNGVCEGTIGDNDDCNYKIIVDENKGAGEFIQIKILNKGSKALKMQIQVQDFIPDKDDVGIIEDHNLKEGQNQITHDDKVKLEGLDYINYLAYMMSYLAKQMDTNLQERIIVEEHDINQVKFLSRSARILGFVSTISVFVMSLVMMLILRSLLRKKKYI